MSISLVIKKLLTILGFLIILNACSPAASQIPAKTDLILATTTSIQDSGLLDVLIPLFEQHSNYTIKTVAVGSGAALKMGEEGNADVLLVHSPKDEKVFMDNGFGRDRFLVMHNDFVLVGPAADPASIKGQEIISAMKSIHTSAAPFISRGDESGTHKMELILWGKAGLSPQDMPWYVETGQGMGATLTIASEKQAYTLTDRSTYLANQKNLELEVLVEGDPSLLNVYHVITVNPQKWEKVNYEGALAFANFLLSQEAQKVIAEYGIEKYGQPLFFADAGKTERELGLE